jgi:hypothetical protein
VGARWTEMDFFGAPSSTIVLHPDAHAGQLEHAACASWRRHNLAFARLHDSPRRRRLSTREEHILQRCLFTETDQESLWLYISRGYLLRLLHPLALCFHSHVIFAHPL